MYKIAIAPYDNFFTKIMSNMQSIAARKGKIILLSNKQGFSALKDICSKTIIVNNCDDFIAPIIYTVPLQLLAYHIAANKNLDIDQPRNLAKSVTVE